jgi:glutamate--cysteine ligase
LEIVQGPSRVASAAVTVLRDPDDVRTWLAANVYAPAGDDPVIGKVGLEAELFPFWIAADGRPAARLALVELMGLLDAVPGSVRNPDSGDGRPSWAMGDVLLTEEPGAQLEIAGPPEPDAHTAVVGLETTIDTITRTFAAAGAGLAAAGLDCWSEPEQVPVQVRVPRYGAMTTYFDRRDDLRQGHLLMCSSCSLQVNVDLGPPAVAPRRWLLANLAAPVITAAFAASPVGAAVNGRAMGWRGLDPTRTGVAPPLVAGSDDPLEHALADAVRADVLLVEREGTAIAGVPGWTFGSWVADGHPRWGHPTAEDLATHLTTLFPESRLRRFLEVRGIDELPGRWRAAAVTLLCGLLYDARASEDAHALLEPHRSDVPVLLERAARAGLRDPLLGELSPRVLAAARDGAARLDLPELSDADAYLETFTHRGLHPSDELREALAEGPASAYRWASTAS